MHAQPTMFSARETHSIALRPENRLLTHSEGLGWRQVYASVAIESSWAGALNSCPDYCIALDLAKPAKVIRRLDGRTESTTFLPRQFTIIPPGQPSWWRIEGTPQVLLVYIRHSVFRSLAAALQLNSPEADLLQPVLAVYDPLIEQLALGILAALRSEQPGDSIYVELLAQGMAAHLLRNYGMTPHPTLPTATPTLPPERMQRVRDYIEAHLDERLSVDSLAATAGLHPVYLARAFRQAWGLPPHQYIQRRRIERAKLLLRATEQSLTDIALSCGFASSSHFSTSFRRLVGRTPSCFRRGS